MLYFQDLEVLGVFRLQQPCGAVSRSYAHALSMSMSCHSMRHACNSFGLLTRGYCEQKNCEKTTSSVLSVMLL